MSMHLSMHGTLPLGLGIEGLHNDSLRVIYGNVPDYGLDYSFS